MISVSQHLSPAQAACLRTEFAALDRAYWRDRSRHKPNLGLNGSPGHYFSCGRIACPEALRLAIDTVAPEWPGHGLEDWVVNWTEPGGGIPPHVDNEGYLAVALLCLQSESGAFVWYRGNDLDRPQPILDRAGQLIRFDDIAQIHRVPPALSDRYVIVFLYR